MTEQERRLQQLVSGQKQFLSNINNIRKIIAYFSMEIGVDSGIPTYSGGLGVLAGDLITTACSLKMPFLGVTLLYKNGYFHQKITPQGQQQEKPQTWNKGKLNPLQAEVSVQIDNSEVKVKAWEYKINNQRAVIFLDTDCQDNTPEQREITHYLYGGDQQMRLAQEIVLGIGGIKILRKIGLDKDKIGAYHMNEGHASLIVLELLKENNQDIEQVKKKCIFTTHTPVPAGHDKFSYELVEKYLGSYISTALIKEIVGATELNMTKLALSGSHFINAVARRHQQTSQKMFPGYKINYITNGVNLQRWTTAEFKEVYDRYIPGWRDNPYLLAEAKKIPTQEIWQAHLQAKIRLLEYVKNQQQIELDRHRLTIGFARRSTSYKRAELIFKDISRLRKINDIGPIQLIFAGKAHPQDEQGKEMIKAVIQAQQALSPEIKAVYLENYDIAMAKLIISGVDLWLNTPQKPQEASGTSGMKAACNGIPSLSILDGWWLEGALEDKTGWIIESKNIENQDLEESNILDANNLYDKLENKIIPIFYNNRQQWLDIMRQSIYLNASLFNCQRLMQEYFEKAYQKVV